jgi:hypothetical protein
VNYATLPDNCVTPSGGSECKFVTRKFIRKLRNKKMKKLIVLFTAIILVTGFTTRVMAQATENTASGAVIVTPITITEVSALHFGVMAVLAATPGTCVLSTTGVRTATGGVNLSAQTPVATNASYTVAGQISTTYALTLPATITVTDGASNTMTIGTLLARFNGAGADAVISTLSGTGTDNFTVGGTLTVLAAQPAGVYAGTFNVTVAYN